MLGQRVLGLALGREDLNDHDELRKEPVVGGALGCLARNREDGAPLAGKSTRNPLESGAAGLSADRGGEHVHDI